MKNLIMTAALVALAGCAPGPRRGYIDKNDDVFGRADTMEYTQKQRSVVQSVEALLTDPMFTTNYDKARKRALDAGRTLPTVAINPIENNTLDGRSDAEATGQLYRELLTALRKTGKFELIDRMRRKQMTDANISGSNVGEEGAALQSVGSYGSADFVITGELRREMTAERPRPVYHHFLNLEMLDSASGSVFWSDTITVTKFGRR